MATATLPLAAISEGDAVTLRVGSTNVIVAQVEGRYYALHGQCTHAGQALTSQCLRGTQLVCPKHGARFDARSGECLAAPANLPLKRYSVIADRGKLIIEVDA